MTSTVEFLYISISYLNKYVAQYPPETVVSCKLTVSVGEYNIPLFWWISNMSKNKHVSKKKGEAFLVVYLQFIHCIVEKRQRIWTQIYIAVCCILVHEWFQLNFQVKS